MGRRLDEVRLPLHILLSSPFGELNENQEEMIGAAQAAAEVADEALSFIGRIVDLDAGRGRVSPRARPPTRPAGASSGRGDATPAEGWCHPGNRLPPLLPHVHVDPQHTREALSLLLNRLADQATPDAEMRLTAEASSGFTRLWIEDPCLGRRGVAPDRKTSSFGSWVD